MAQLVVGHGRYRAGVDLLNFELQLQQCQQILFFIGHIDLDHERGFSGSLLLLRLFVGVKRTGEFAINIAQHFVGVQGFALIFELLGRFFTHGIFGRVQAGLRFDFFLHHAKRSRHGLFGRLVRLVQLKVVPVKTVGVSGMHGCGAIHLAARRS